MEARECDVFSDSVPFFVKQSCYILQQKNHLCRSEVLYHSWIVVEVLTH